MGAMHLKDKIQSGFSDSEGDKTDRQATKGVNATLEDCMRGTNFSPTRTELRAALTR